MNKFKNLFHQYFKFPLIFSILSLFTSSVVISEIYLLLINENYSFIVSTCLYVLSLSYAFVVWISINDSIFQGICGFISISLFLSAVADSLIIPNWYLQSHFINKMAIFTTNLISSFSALSFLWSKIISFITGPSSRAMPISEKHEGIIYVSINMFLSLILSFLISKIDADTLFGYREQIIDDSFLILSISTIFGFFLGILIGYKRSRFHDLPNAKDGVVIDVE